VAGNAQLQKAWKEANELVRAAEDRLSLAWEAFSKQQAGPPSKELLEEVAQLRRECDKRLKAILDGHAKRGKPAASTDSERPNS
jgi:hypothetical protein